MPLERIDADTIRVTEQTVTEIKLSDLRAQLDNMRENNERNAAVATWRDSLPADLQPFVFVPPLMDTSELERLIAEYEAVS